jgi:hypothetical protein
MNRDLAIAELAQTGLRLANNTAALFDPANSGTQLSDTYKSIMDDLEKNEKLDVAALTEVSSIAVQLAGMFMVLPGVLTLRYSVTGEDMIALKKSEIPSRFKDTQFVKDLDDLRQKITANIWTMQEDHHVAIHDILENKAIQTLLNKCILMSTSKNSAQLLKYNSICALAEFRHEIISKGGIVGNRFRDTMQLVQTYFAQQLASLLTLDVTPSEIQSIYSGEVPERLEPWSKQWDWKVMRKLEEIKIRYDF